MASITRHDPSPTIAASLSKCLGGDHHNGVVRQPLVPVVSADIDHLQAILRPHPPPATVIGGIGKRGVKEREAVEAMTEETVMEAVAIVEREAGGVRREGGMRGKGRARKARTCETRTDAAKVRACAHTTDMHPAAHSASVHAHPATTHTTAAKATAMAAATTTASTSRQR
jgi:hypothetical protein